MEKYLWTPEIWKDVEAQLLALVNKRGITEYIDGKGEAAMYGPKIDFIAHDSIGRVLQVATIQLDFNMPERFKLYCINEKSEKEPIVMIHCAIMGSIERFMATLIEHLAGNFPVWLSPVQVKVMPITDDHLDFALEVTEKLKAGGIRAELDNSRDGLGKKVRNAKLEKLPYWIVIGAKEIESKKVALEHREKGQLGQLSIEETIEKLQKEIAGKVL
jgi:threonyl-tRNA synthetase